LLWGKDNDYEGPLFNSYEANEWVVILLLISNWLLEVYDKISNNSKSIKYEINQFMTKQNISNISIYIIKEIIKLDLIPGINTQKILQNISLYENNGIIRELIEDSIYKIIDEIENLIMNGCQFKCCMSKKSNTKKIVMAKSKDIGKMSKMINRSIHVNNLIQIKIEKKT